LALRLHGVRGGRALSVRVVVRPGTTVKRSVRVR
jgi:hypothetical protein